MPERLVEVKVDDKELKQMARRMGIAKKALPKVVCRAIRSTATQTRTIIKNVVRGKIPELPASQVHKRTYIRPKATYGKLSSIVNISWRIIPLKRIRGVRGKGRNPSKSYISWKGKTFPHAFRATMPSGHVGIFMRKFLDRSKPILTWAGELLGMEELGKGLPIQELGVNVKDVYHTAPSVKEKIDTQTTEKLRINITSQFNRLIK